MMTALVTQELRFPPALEQPSEQEQTHAMLAHLLTSSGYVVPFGQVFGPALILLMQKKPGSSFVIGHAKEAINFQLTWFLPVVLLGIAAVMSFFLIGIPFFIALLPVVLFGAVFTLVMPLVAALRANRGESYQSPATIRFLR